MKRNFKVIKIAVSSGAYQLLYSGLSEMAAWEISDKLERSQMELGNRLSWFAVTNSGDWQNMAAAFYRMRKTDQV